MSIPIVLTTSSRMVMDVADYVMITWLNDPASQAAMLPAQLIMWCYLVIGMGTISLTSTFASQCLGQRKYTECSAYGWQVLYLSAGFAAVALALWPMVPRLIEWIGHEPAVRRQEWAYAGIAVLTVAPTVAARGLDGFFTGIHRPWVATWSMIEANVVNVVVSWVLIFGKLGFEPMGIAGAAWGTMTAVCYRTLRLSLTMVTPAMSRQFNTRRTWRPSWRRMKDILRVGGPTGLQWLSDVTVWAVFITVLVGRLFGTDHQIATNNAWQYLKVSFMPTVGVGMALTALVGKSIGRGDPRRAIRETRVVAGLTLAYMGALSIVYFVWGRELVGFLTHDNASREAIIRIGGSVMICAAIFQIFDALGITYMSALRGAGDTFWPSFVSIVSHWVVVIGGGFLVAGCFPQYGSIGPWGAASALIVLIGVYLWWRWHSRAWMKLNIFSRSSSAKTVT